VGGCVAWLEVWEVTKLYTAVYGLDMKRNKYRPSHLGCWAFFVRTRLQTIPVRGTSYGLQIEAMLTRVRSTTKNMLCRLFSVDWL
jgi:hypothetical protein